VFKARLEGALSNLVWWKVSLLMAGGWNQMIFKVPSNPYVLVSAAAGNKKRHVAAPPPAGVRRRMERSRQKPVGRDKGSLTEQQTEGTVTTTDKIQIRRKYDTNSHKRPALPDRTGAARCRAASESPPCCPPHRNSA